MKNFYKKYEDSIIIMINVMLIILGFITKKTIYSAKIQHFSELAIRLSIFLRRAQKKSDVSRQPIFKNKLLKN